MEEKLPRDETIRRWASKKGKKNLKKG